MDPTTAAGVAVLIAKLGAFALIIAASRRASAAVGRIEARRAREAEARAAAARPAAVRAEEAALAVDEAAAPDRPVRIPEPA